MRKLLLNLLFISFLLCFVVAAGYDISKGRYYPELAGLGNTGVAGYLVPNAVQLNPANLAHYNGWNNYWYGATLENDLSHNDFTMSLKLFDVSFGLSYIYQNLGNIPNTGLYSGRIRQNGSFSEYITQTQLHTATQLTNLPLLKEFDIGASVGLQKYSFMSDQDLFYRFGSVFSFDLVPDLYFGFLLNDASEAKQMNYGIQYKQPKYKIFIDNGDKGIAGGAEYSLSNMLSVRGGIDKDFLGLGLGLIYDKLYFFGKEDMGLGIDYTVQIPLDKYPFETQHLLGITVREQDKLPIPFLYKYPPYTNKRFANVVGWSLRDTNVQVFYKDVLIDIVKVNQNGNWEAKLPLNSELNDFHFKAIQKGPRKESLASKKYRIIVDQIPPDFRFDAVVNSDAVSVDVYPTEMLADAPFVYELNRLSYFNKNKYSFESEFDNIYDGFILRLNDYAGNESIIGIEEPFIRFSAPNQQLVVTYKDSYQFIGNAGIYHNLTVKNLRNLFEEAIPLTGKINTTFKPIISLEYGYNNVVFTDKLPKGNVRYNYSFYRLFNYKDINDREIDLLATCYVLPKSQLLEPLKRVREQELVKWVYSLMVLNSLSSARECSVDEAYDYVLKNRIVSKREDLRYISRGEAIDLLSRVFGYVLYDTHIHSKYFDNINTDHPYIKSINYFVEKGFINIEGRYYDPEVIITRQELIGWLKESPYFIKLLKEIEEE